MRIKFNAFSAIIFTFIFIGWNSIVTADTPAETIEVTVSADSVASDLTAALANKTKIVEGELSETKKQHFQETLDSIPNLNWASGSSRPRFFQIRGIGELEQYEGAPNSSVAFLLDDFDLSGSGTSASLFDVAEINVLRGPQGFGFGPSALAGLVQLRSLDPTSEFSSHAELSAGNDDMVSAGAAVSGPLTEYSKDLLFRFSAFDYSSNGFRNNLYLNRDDTNRRQEFTGRAKLRWLATRVLTVDLNLLHLDSDNGYDAFTIDNSFNTQSDRPGMDTQITDGASVKLNFDLGDRVNLVSTSSVTRTDSDYSYDGEWGNNPFWAPYDPYDYFSFTNRRRDTYSNELRLHTIPSNDYLGKEWNFLTGIYLRRLAEDSFNDEYSNNEIFDNLDSSFVSKTNAVFSAVEMPLMPGNSITGGLRLEDRASDFRDTKGAEFEPDEKMWGGLLGLKHQINKQHLLSLSASRGYKGGGFNTGANIPRQNLSFDPEHLYNFEIGANSSFFGGKVNSTLALFYTLRREQQVKFALQDDPTDPLSFTYITDNAARGRNIGSELEVNWSASERLNVYTRAALLDAEFNKFSYLDRNLSGRDQSHAPNWQHGTGFKYSFNDNIYIRSEITGRDAFYFDDSHDQRSKSYHLLSAALGYDLKQFSVVLWARNILDKRYALRGFYFGDEPPDYPNKLYVQQGDPRQFGVTFSYNF